VLEGLVTILGGIVTPFILPDSIDKANFLTAQEKALIKLRLQQDSGTASGTVEVDEKFQWRFLRAAFLDWKIWFAILIFWGNT
jgi:hypothetical protein